MHFVKNNQEFLVKKKRTLSFVVFQEGNKLPIGGVVSRRDLEQYSSDQANDPILLS